MLSKLTSLDDRLLSRRCVACGYDGTLLETGSNCPRCGIDLVLRPPRSYAEMEGLFGEPLTLDAPLARAKRTHRLARRWMMFFTLAMLAVLAIVYLAMAAVTV